MKWFKHDTSASSDAKVKKLIIRHGAIGYAVYFHCLELIAGDITSHKLTFELEHDSEIIADNLKIQGSSNEAGIDLVNRIMNTIIDIGLFDCSGDKIHCLKLAKRLDTSMTSNPDFRKKIKESHDAIMTGSCKNRIEEKIEDRKELNNNMPKPKKPKKVKHKHGEYKHVLLTDDEYNKLLNEWGEVKLSGMIKTLDEGIELKPKKYSYNNHNLALRNWEKNNYDKPDKAKSPPTREELEAQFGTY